METLLWIIFIFIFLGYAFKFFLKYGLPWLLGRFIRNQQEKYNGFGAQNTYNGPGTAEGDIRVKTDTKTKKPKKDEGFGEYVEYEDLD
jgi:hypothetical protein